MNVIYNVWGLMMVAGVTEQWSTLCVDHSARNKDQKLVGHFIKIGYFIGY